ncbi:MAG: dihydropteroate synthase [Bacteroidota bacterium]
MTHSDTGEAVFAFGPVRYDLASRPFVMGILNVTPDSFSDGGRFAAPQDAIQHGVQLVADGADFLDIGGESTRPGSDPVSVEEELRRVIPVISGLRESVSIPISIDTYKSEVARESLDAGATIVNDVSGLTFDARMAAVIAEHKATVIVMHMKGTPKSMQENPQYGDLLREVREFLWKSSQSAKTSGIRQIIVDPGIGFGKTMNHNLELMKRLPEIVSLGYPVLVGPSRKSFIGTILNAGPDQRLEGTIAASVICAMKGASIVRVHDVKETVRALKILRAVEHS